MNDWHISLHRWDGPLPGEKPIVWNDSKVVALCIESSQLGEPFDIGFDAFLFAVNQLPGGYAEGDGSFGIVGENGSWRICGTVFDVSGTLQYVELIGSCPVAEFQRFIALLELPTSDHCVVQMMQGGFFISVTRFAEWAAAAP